MPIFGEMRLWLVPLVLLVAVPAPAAAAGGAPKLRSAAPLVVGERIVEPGGTIAVVDHVRNRGRVRSRATRSRFFLSRDIRRSRDDIRVGGRRIPPLGHVAASRKTVQLRVPPATARGLWRLMVCVRKRCRTSPLPLRVGRAPVTPAGAPIPAHDPDAGLAREVPGSNGLKRVRDCNVRTAAADAPPEAFTAMFASSRDGYTGGDAAYSVPLPNGSTAWLFGDSYIGRVTDEGTRKVAWYQARNSAVVQDDCLNTLFHGTYDYPSAFQLGDQDPESEWYWPNKPVVHGDQVRAFWTRTVKTPGGYQPGGGALATYDLEMRLQGIRTIPTGHEREWWGAAVVDAAPYTYVFGLRHTNTTQVLVARTPLGNLDGTWEYRTANGWGASPADAVAVHQHVSAQYSVVRDGRGWSIVSQMPGTRQVNAWRAPEPWGPYPHGQGAPVVELPDVPGSREYNPLVHDGKTSGGRLLISYNVMPDSESLLLSDASLYRPRFLRAPLP